MFEVELELHFIRLPIKNNNGATMTGSSHQEITHIKNQNHKSQNLTVPSILPAGGSHLVLIPHKSKVVALLPSPSC